MVLPKKQSKPRKLKRQMSRGTWECEEGLNGFLTSTELTVIKWRDRWNVTCTHTPTLRNNTSHLKGQKPFHLEEKILGHIPKSLHENEK